jgi:hypothetical protein
MAPILSLLVGCGAKSPHQDGMDEPSVLKIDGISGKRPDLTLSLPLRYRYVTGGL